MKVALVADSQWLLYELPILRRLVVGLLDEQMPVVRVVPQWWVDTEENLAMTGESLPYATTKWRWLRDRRLRQLADRLRSADVDLIHVLDGSLQRVGLDMARALNLPVIVSVWSRAFADTVSPDSRGVTVACAVATQDLVERCRRRMGPGTTVVRIPPGVYRADESVEPPLRSPTESLNIVVMGDGRLDRYYEALMEGMVRTRAKLPHAMYFFYSVDADQHAIWQHARRLDLLNQITLVPVDPATRDLMIRADVMIQPQPLGRARTLILEAMAAGRPIIATEDPVLDYLRANETAALMPHAVPDAWATLLAQLVIEPARFIALGESARQYVNTHHTASQFIARTMELYQQVVTPTALPFPK